MSQDTVDLIGQGVARTDIDNRFIKCIRCELISTLSEIEVQINLVSQGITQGRSQGQDGLGAFHGTDFFDGIRVVFQELDSQPADRIFDDAHFFDGIGQIGDSRFDVGTIIDFGIDQVLRLRAGNGVEQFFRADVLAADKGHDDGAELLSQFLEVDFDAHAVGNVHHVQGDDHGPAQFDKLCRQI